MFYVKIDIRLAKSPITGMGNLPSERTVREHTVTFFQAIPIFVGALSGVLLA